jgi:hypothetical protein
MTANEEFKQVLKTIRNARSRLPDVSMFSV